MTTTLTILFIIGLIFALYLNYKYIVQNAKDNATQSTTKAIGQYLSENAHLFKQPSTSNAVYLIGMYYLKNGQVEMDKVEREVFELGLNKLVENKKVLLNGNKECDWNPHRPKIKFTFTKPDDKPSVTDFGPR